MASPGSAATISAGLSPPTARGWCYQGRPRFPERFLPPRGLFGRKIPAAALEMTVALIRRGQGGDRPYRRGARSDDKPEATATLMAPGASAVMLRWPLDGHVHFKSSATSVPRALHAL